MAASSSLYDVLGVSPTSDAVVIEAAYKALIKKHHPDRNLHDRGRAEEKAKQLNEAFSVLGDAHKRAHYDHVRARDSYKPGPSDAGSDAPFRAPPGPTHSARGGMSPPPHPTSYSGASPWSKRAASLLAVSLAVGMPLLLLKVAGEGPAPAARASGAGVELLIPSPTRLAAARAKGEAQRFASGASAASVTEGAHAYRLVAGRGGMAAAEEYSRSCYEALANTRSSADLDFCAGFDAAGSLSDRALSKMAGGPAHPYFDLTTSQGRSFQALLELLRVREDAAAQRVGLVWARAAAQLREGARGL